MSQLVIYNWTPWKIVFSLNDDGVSNPSGPLNPSQQGEKYLPWSRRLPIDLSHDTGTSNSWGKANELTVRCLELAKPMNFQRLMDPDSSSDSDLFLWLFPNRVVFSQKSNFLKEVFPDP